MKMQQGSDILELLRNKDVSFRVDFASGPTANCQYKNPSINTNPKDMNIAVEATALVPMVYDGIIEKI